MPTELSMLELKPISYLYSQKENELIHELTNLQLQDVKKDATFAATVKRIKKEILLTPVVISERQIGSHRSEQRNFQSGYENPFPHSKTVLIVSVNFLFSGSSELFTFAPDGLVISSSDTRVQQPNYSNTISLEVVVEKLEKDIVLSKANEKMKSTFSLINQINPQAENWSAAKERSIDAALQTKRKEIIDFYK